MAVNEAELQEEDGGLLEESRKSMTLMS